MRAINKILEAGKLIKEMEQLQSGLLGRIGLAKTQVFQELLEAISMLHQMQLEAESEWVSVGDLTARTAKRLQTAIENGAALVEQIKEHGPQERVA